MRSECSLLAVTETLALVLLIATVFSLAPAKTCTDLCNEIKSEVYSAVFQDTATIRIVDPSQAQNDTVDCLNPWNSASPPPCATLQFALGGSLNTSVYQSVKGLRVYLKEGTYRATNSIKVVNSQEIAIIGGGLDLTKIICGEDGIGTQDSECLFENLQVLNSTHVLLANLTFTGCGPIAASVYIANSEYVLLEDCVIR